MVIAGKDRGQKAKITRVLPRESSVVLDGLNLVKRHRRPSSRNRKGQIIDISMPIHASNVMLLDPKSGKPTRVRIVRGKDGARQRVAAKSGEAIK